MTMNSTIWTLKNHHHHHHPIESIEEPTAINELALERYDSAGAALFIVVVLLWYSTGLVCMVGTQIRARSETIEDCVRRQTKLFIQTLRDQTQTKEILEELADKENRDKLWNIYLGKTDTNTDKLKRAESHRIRNIKKQLAVINRTRVIMNETLISPIVHSCIRRKSLDSQSVLIPNLQSIENQSRTRRRSSFDQQILERWKSIINETRAHQQLPWAIRKRLISRHFRRYCQNSSNEFERIDATRNDSSLNHEHLETIDDEQCHLLPSHKEINHNSRPVFKDIDNRLNPYMTYFHLPINENFESNIQDLPLAAIRSDHRIIQMYHDESQC